ncbi:MAG: bifunctional demethylmenaquinone methyltransferase/2-methoxy-6-polyprenyl-1,4-benzoquinol methylase UbiE [Okeania sp. SIO2H7]|nr:bifunctional demethylmenaquinone methyltransferase/2-methoxy-6-polyprenyl-1,4-benzoquinol methylase UbiE [Okeania sp. SIO2H7]
MQSTEESTRSKPCIHSSAPTHPLAPFPSNASPANPAEVEALFNRIAPVYDQLNHWLSLGQHKAWKHMAVRWSNARQGHTCLDICCGSGDLTRMLAEATGPSGNVIGLDFASEQLERAETIAYLKFGSDRIQWIHGDALSLPFEPNTFDAITMGYGLRNVADIDRALAEIWRVLKPGGTAAILDFHKPQNQQIWEFQTWCLDTIVVPLANRFDLYNEYAYIRPSLERFPQGPQQVNLAKAVGFVQPVHYAIAGGMMGILVAQK